MWPSTWASSVETWVRLNSQRRAPTASRLTRATPMTANAMRRRPPGRGAAAVRASGAAAASRRNPGSVLVCASGLVIVAMVVAQFLVEDVTG